MAEHEQLTASRGKFLGAAGITGAALAAGAWRTDKAGAAPHAAKADKRSYVAGNFFLELDGVKTGFVRSADGGAIVGEVVNMPSGSSYFEKKHIGNVKYEDMTIEIGLAMSKMVYDWISTTLKGSKTRKSGAVIAGNFNYDAMSTREFSNALITEVGFPALDASSKDTAFLTVTFAPETTRLKPASGKVEADKTQQQKKWLPSNFRLDIKGLPTSKINKVDALTIKQTVVTGEIGDSRDYEQEPTKLEYPNLSFTLPETDAQPWLDWHEAFVIKGNNGDEQEKSGALTYLAPDLKSELGRLDFFNLGIFKVAPEKVESSSEQIRRVKVELYCERIEFVHLG